MGTINKRINTRWLVIDEETGYKSTVYKSKADAESHRAQARESGHKRAKLLKRESVAYQARVRLSLIGKELVETFADFQAADEWVKAREGEIVKRQFVDYSSAETKTLADLFDRYEQEFLARESTDCPEKARLGKMRRHDIANIKLIALQNRDFNEYREVRLAGGYQEKRVPGQKTPRPWTPVKGSTVRKELELIARIINLSRKEWGIHLPHNPCSSEFVARPGAEVGDERDRRLEVFHDAEQRLQMKENISKAARGRRVHAEVQYGLREDVSGFLDAIESEQQLVLRAARYPHWFRPVKLHVSEATLRARARAKTKAPVKARLRDKRRLWAFLSFAVETAMRRGEIVKLRWSYVNLSVGNGYIELPAEVCKNNTRRIVPLTLRAKRILLTQPQHGDLVFNTTENTISTAYKRLKKVICISDLRVHDLRHEATSRLFERTDLRAIEVGAITGHKDLRTLRRYANARPHALVQRFQQSFNTTVKPSFDALG